MNWKAILGAILIAVAANIIADIIIEQYKQNKKGA